MESDIAIKYQPGGESILKIRCAICIPTYNAGASWKLVLESIGMQTVQPLKKIVIDSNSKDDTAMLAVSAGFEVIKILPTQFDHGGTRQMLADSAGDIDIVVYLTQDAIFSNDKSLEIILAAFKSSDVGLAYGRQLPHINAKVLESHARLFNYPGKSQLRGLNTIDIHGFKTIFSSNSFAAYNLKALKEVGGFPIGNIMGEDTVTAAKMIKSGWKIAYVAEAKVYHSHSYSITEEFKRYFDTGVFHAQNLYLYDTFGKPTGEGLKFVISEFKYTIKKSTLDALTILPRTAAKFMGFKLGLNYKKLPLNIIKLFSMHENYWDK